MVHTQGVTDDIPAPGLAPSAGGGAAAHETHLSWIALLGDRAFKVLKPVDLGFVDHRRRGDRRRALVRELEVNRRFAPDVYLGVVDVCGEDGPPCDHALVMRRMPSARCLAALLDGPDAAAHVTDVAHAVARIHAAAPGGAAIVAAGGAERRLRLWSENVEHLRAHAPDVVDQEQVAQVLELARRFIRGREALFAHRMEAGWVRDGHGDLLVADTYCMDDGPRFLDCLAFDDAMRHGDVLTDVAFLAMDLEHRGRRDLAELLVARWAQALGEAHPATLLHLDVAYRAHVRAKVTAMRAADDGDGGAASEARDLHALALAHLRAGAVRLVLVGGTPGTGKSTVAAELSRATGWRVLRTDALRAGVVGAGGAGAPDAYDAGRYAPSARDAVYATMLAAAREALALGEPVILDASWGRAAHRAAAWDVARAADADLVELRCDAPADVADARIVARRPGDDPSEVTPALAARMRAEADPWSRAVVVRTDIPLAHTVAAALAAVGPV